MLDFSNPALATFVVQVGLALFVAALAAAFILVGSVMAYSYRRIKDHGWYCLIVLGVVTELGVFGRILYLVGEYLPGLITGETLP